MQTFLNKEKVLAGHKFNSQKNEIQVCIEESKEGKHNAKKGRN